MLQVTDTQRYARCIEVSKRVRFDIERDVIRSRTLDKGKKFLPDGLSKAHELEFLRPAEARLMSQIQGRTYANMFGLVERFIGPKMSEVSRDHWLGDQTAFEALVRFTDEELKHQELFRRMERLAGADMQGNYRFVPQPNDVARAVLGKSTWAVLALICHIELFVLAHFREAIEPDPELSELWKDVFTFHAREESQHAILDELEWRREHAKLSAAEREQGVNDLIDLVAAVDGIVQMQATADSDYQAVSGMLIIPSGQTTGTITVLFNGDRLGEPNESFFVNLSSPTNAFRPETFVASQISDVFARNASQIADGAGRKYGWKSKTLTAASHSKRNTAPNTRGGHTSANACPGDRLTAPPSPARYPARRPSAGCRGGPRAPR